VVEAGDTGDGGYHHSGEELHGGNVALVEGRRGRGEDFKNAESAAVMAQGRDENGAHTETAAAGEIDARIALGVVAEHDFAGAHGLGGDARIGLQANAEIGSGASSASAADNFVASTQRDRSAGSAGQMLGTLGDRADGGLEIKFGGMNFEFIANRYSLESGSRMGGIGYAELTALRKRGHAGMICIIQNCGIGNRAEQIADEIIEFGISDQVRRLLVAERSAKHARKPEEGMTATGQTVRLAVVADQLTLNAKRGGLQ